MQFCLGHALFAAGLASSELLSLGSLRGSTAGQYKLGSRHWKLSEPLECFQTTSPIDTPDGLAIGNRIVEKHDSLPSCSTLLMNHSFANSYGKPFVGKFS